MPFDHPRAKSAGSNIFSSDSLCFIQDYLAAQQSLVNEKLYRDKYGLFLNDGERSELEAITSFDHHGPSGSKLVTASYDHHRCVLTNADEIRALFTCEQKGLVILHVGQDNSFSRLKITRPCFNQLLRSAEICHALKDNILHIGYRTMDVEIAPPAPSLRFLYDSEQLHSPICGLEVAYGLRFIELNGRDDGDPWSMRQCVIYNKTHHTKDTAQWMFFCLPKVLRRQVDDSLDKLQQALVLQPFDVHLMLFSTTTDMWRPYFIHITQEIESCRNQVNMSDPRSHGSLKNVHEETFIVLKDYEFDMLNAMLAIRATKRTLAHHHNVYQSWCASQTTLNGQAHTSSIDLRFSELSQRLEGTLDQAQSLLEKIRSISETVANFLALASSYSAESLAEQSRSLAELSRIDSSRMKTMTEIAQKDTKAVKALSVITLIYLPVTVVLNFFSTSFVSEDHGDVRVVGRWWLLIATSVPLTVLTLIAWAFWICREKLRWRPVDLEIGLSPATTLVGSSKFSYPPPVQFPTHDTGGGCNAVSHTQKDIQGVV